MRRRTVQMLPPAAGLLVAGALALAGCSSPLPWSPRTLDPAEPYINEDPNAVCAPSTAAWGRVPDDFEPVGVYVCEMDPPVAIGEEGGPTPPPPLRTGDLTPLLEALAQPSDPVWTGPCPAIGWAGPTLVLADADGRLVQAAYPSTGCGLPKEDAYAAVEAALADIRPAG
jgi:hypothetical protein